MASSGVDPIRVRTAKIKKMFHRLYKDEDEIEKLRLRIKELTEELEIHRATARSLQKIIDAGKPRTNVLSRRKSIAIPQQMVDQVQEANLSRRFSLRKSFADEGILNAFRVLPELDPESPTLKKISVSVMKLHFESPLLGVKLITKISPTQPTPELVVESKHPQEGVTFRRYSIVRPKVVERIAFWCNLHKFPTDIDTLPLERRRSTSVIQK
jgi:hypothetical protein